MRWVLAGLLFALTVGLAIGTVAQRADNTRCRRKLELEYRSVQDRVIEVRRMSIRSLQQSTPERLAAELRALLAQGRAAAPRLPAEGQGWQ